MSLAGVKVGDEVVTTYVSRRGERREKVAAVGRKYATIGGREYDLETGLGTGDFASHYRAYTLAGWARRELKQGLHDALTNLRSLSYKLDHLTEDEVREATATIEKLTARLAPPTTPEAT